MGNISDSSRKSFNLRLGLGTGRVLGSPELIELLRTGFLESNAPVDFEVDLDKLEPDEDTFEWRAYDAIEAIVTQGHNFHKGSPYMDAVTLVDPSGRVLMICGASGAGKTTTGVALTLTTPAKFVSEDIVTFDQKGMQILQSTAPLSIRPKTMNLFEELNIPLPTLVGNRFFLAPQLFDHQHRPLKIDLLVLLGPMQEGAPLATRTAKPAEALRRMLPISNFLVHPEMPDILLESLSSTKIICMDGGTLRERLAFVESEFG